MLKYEIESREVTSKDSKTQAQIRDHVVRNRNAHDKDELLEIFRVGQFL